MSETPHKARKGSKAAQSKPLAGDKASAAVMRSHEPKGRLQAFKSIIDAIDDPDLFGNMFDAPSWEPWRAFLKALQGLPMTAEHLALYRHHTGRTEPPTMPARYAQLVVGRRGGKSRILALIATYLACVLDHSDYIVPGETPVVAIIAKDRR